MIVDFGSGEYYLYRHVRLDNNEPFYIGISKKSRDDIKYGYYKRAKDISRRSEYWKNIVNKTSFIIEILFESNSKEFIIQKELEFISLYGRKNLNKGSLVNLTDGGEFFEGYIPTREKIERVANKIRGIKRNKEKIKNTVLIKRQNAITRGYWFSPETILKMSEARKGKKLSTESIEKRTITRKANNYRYSDKTKEKMREKHIERKLKNKTINNENKDKKIT